MSVIGIRCNGYYLAEGLVSTSAFLHSWKWVSWALNLAQLSVGNFSRNWPAVSLLPARLGCSLKALQLAVLMTRYRITACQRTEAIAPTERERETARLSECNSCHKAAGCLWLVFVTLECQEPLRKHAYLKRESRYIYYIYTWSAPRKAKGIRDRHGKSSNLDWSWLSGVSFGWERNRKSF